MEGLRAQEKIHTFENLEYEGDPEAVFKAIDDHLQFLDRKNRGENVEEPKAVPLGLSGGGGWATINGLANFAALNESGLLRGLHTIMCTSNGVNTAAYAIADQVRQALPFFTRKAVVHRTLNYIPNLYEFGRPANPDNMSRLVAGRMIKGEQGRRLPQSVTEELNEGVNAERYDKDKARAEGKKVFDFLKLDAAQLKSAGPRLYTTLTDAETGEGTTVCINDAKEPVVPLSASIALPFGYPDTVTVDGKPMMDGGFAYSNL